MPQLDLVSFLSQYFWLLVGFIGFYLYLYKNFLPKMYRIYSVREKLSNKSHDSKSNFQTSFTEASKTKQNLFANVMGYAQQTLQTAQVSVDQWKETHSKQLLDSSLVKFTNTFKKAVTLQALSQFLVLKYAAPLTVSSAFSSGILPTSESAKKALNSASFHKLGDQKNWKSTLLKSENVYVPFVGLKRLTTDILSASGNKTTSTKIRSISSAEKLDAKSVDTKTSTKKTSAKVKSGAKSSSKKKA